VLHPAARNASLVIAITTSVDAPGRNPAVLAISWLVFSPLS
jgi:hypothetical protein